MVKGGTIYLDALAMAELLRRKREDETANATIRRIFEIPGEARRKGRPRKWPKPKRGQSGRVREESAAGS